ncbi:Flavohemoprotein (Hemoglobin-like protein) (Flavohemoglobin) (Nitric oxide dioxygenase) [Minicystis rosea]|nr:Flavohemoprotein (Hemoglobin-like protein) (Flavohemoglobin) (Nitric oxide dioxygenase) [Minicystis rosea]
MRRLDIDGDGQGDLVGHGGEHRAVFVYQIESYRHWEKQLGRSDFTYGQFGENFTIDGLPDNEVCVGDRYRIGSTLFEVTQPRVTCYRVGIRMNEPRMAALLTSSGRTGFYLRVLEEGEVGAGDPIVKVAEGPERMTIEQINALLYLPGHPRSQLERALRIPALPAGWRASFEALLQDRGQQAGTTGNAGLSAAAITATKPGFIPLRISQIHRESLDVLSFSLEPVDGHPLATPLPGQFIVLRLRTEPNGSPLYRSYSLSGPPSAARYRVSVKIEPDGRAGTYLKTRARIGDILDASGPRGGFILRAGEGPVVLLSAGIGATPVLAMLHALAATASGREIWWLHGARNRASHPFALDVRRLVATLARGRSHVCYSRPAEEDELGQDYDAVGHLDAATLDALAVPRDGDFYLCGPPLFMHDLIAGLAARSVPPDRIHTETFAGLEALTPGIAGGATRAPHVPNDEPTSGPLVSFARSGLAVHWPSTKHRSLLELAEACDVPVRWSCRTGVCHTCESGLVSGSVDYDPEPLDPPAEGNVLLCCSRPRGDVVIDV